MESQEDRISFSIRRIKDFAFEINESIIVDRNNNSRVTFDNGLAFSADTNQIDFIIDVKFFVSDASTDAFLRGKVLTSFYVENLARFIDEESNNLTMPQPVLVMMLSMALTHARALIAKGAMGSRFNDIYMPIVNPSEVLAAMVSQLSHTPTDKQ